MIDSCLAAWMKPQVFTSTTLASPSSVSSQPGRGQPRRELFGIDLVAGAAQRDQVDRTGRGLGTWGHTESLPSRHG